MESVEKEACLNENLKRKDSYFRRKWDSITLEPLWFGVSCSIMISIVAYKNVYIQRACMVDLGHSEETCLYAKGINKTLIEKEAQRIVATILAGSNFIGGFVTILMVVFLGPWSDVSGKRKPLIIMPIIGMILGNVVILVMQYFPKLPTIYLIYGHYLPLAMGGHFPILGIAAMSYLGDICYKTGRSPTVVIGSNSGFFSFFMIIGTILGPILYRTMGFKGLFIVCIMFELQSLLYAIFRVEDVFVKSEKHNILNLKFPFEALKCVFKKRDGYKQRNIILMVIVPCCNSLIYVAEVGINYLYLRNKFEWTEVEYSVYLTFKSILHVIGTFFIIYVFSKIFKIRDDYIGIVGGVSQLLASIGFMLSSNPILVFVTTLVGLFARGSMIAERPVLNRQITANEQGKVSCVMSIFEKCMSFAILPLANFIYSKTLDTFPSCFTFISVFSAVLQIICFLLVKMDQNSEEQIGRDDEKEPEINLTTSTL